MGQREHGLRDLQRGELVRPAGLALADPDEGRPEADPDEGIEGSKADGLRVGVAERVAPLRAQDRTHKPDLEDKHLQAVQPSLPLRFRFVRRRHGSYGYPRAIGRSDRPHRWSLAYDRRGLHHDGADDAPRPVSAVYSS